MIPMSTAVAQAHRARASSAGAAPEVGATNGDPNLRSVIALSATPAPPAPEVSVPAGNLAARIAISPEGKRPGSPNGNGGANGNTLQAWGTAGHGIVASLGKRQRRQRARRAQRRNCDRDNRAASCC